MSLVFMDSFDAYSDLVRRFCPVSCSPKLLEIISPAAVEQATSDIHTQGIDGVVERLRAPLAREGIAIGA